MAMIFGNIAITLVLRIQNIFMANSLTDRERTTGCDMRSTIIKFFGVFAPLAPINLCFRPGA
jgi:hypothetical protein